MDEFVKVAEQMRQAPTTSRKARDYSRVFLSGASDEVPDKQGRFTIPAKLREYAGLDREVTVIGAGSRLEVWDSVAWNAYLEETEQSFAETEENPRTLLSSRPTLTCVPASSRSAPGRLPRPGRGSGWGPAPR